MGLLELYYMFSIPPSLSALIHSHPRTGSNESSSIDIISSKLRAIGAISLEEYLNSTEEDLRAIRYDASSPRYKSRDVVSLEQTRSGGPLEFSKPTAEEELNATCMKVFGHTDVMKYEFAEDGESAIQCLLSFTWPDGTQETYQSQPNHRSRAQAKADVERVAICTGVVDFINKLDASSTERNLSSAHAPMDETPLATPDEDSQELEDTPIEVIEKCFRRWKPGMAAPRWYEFNHRLKEDSYGAALRVQLTSTNFRVYSTPPALYWPDALQAKAECARIAIEDGVLDFIKSEGLQGSTSSSALVNEPVVPESEKILSIAEFRSSLPQPFPEPVFNTRASPENSISTWFNELMQNVGKGYKITAHFHYTRVKALHGCVLQIEGPSMKTFVVDCHFSKRKDAKRAVCLQAMSEGLGHFVRSGASSASEETHREAESQEIVGAPAEVSEEMRRRVHDTIWPELFAECQAISHYFHPVLRFKKSRSDKRHGCVLKLVLPRYLSSRKSSQPKSPPQRVVFRVPPRYMTLDDAKVAVCCLAAESGVMDFLRSRGKIKLTGASSSSSRTQAEQNGKGKRSESSSPEPGEVEVTSDEEGASSEEESGTRLQNSFAGLPEKPAFLSPANIPSMSNGPINMLPSLPPIHVQSFHQSQAYPQWLPQNTYSYSVNMSMHISGYAYNTPQIGGPSTSGQFGYPQFPKHSPPIPQSLVNSQQSKRKATDDLKKEGSSKKRQKQSKNKG